MCIGEAPGANEEEQGQPFVGKAGMIFDNWLVDAGIDRDATYVTNVFHIRPPENKIDEFFVGTRFAQEQNIEYNPRIPTFNGNWLMAEYEKEYWRLKKEIRLYKPAVIITLGKVALWAVNGNDDYKDRLNEFVGCQFRQQSIVMPVYHPSYWDRGKNSLMLEEIMRALKRARKRAKKVMKP